MRGCFIPFSDPLGRPAPGAECLVYPFARRFVWREKETRGRQAGGESLGEIFLFSCLSLTTSRVANPRDKTWLADQLFYERLTARPSSASAHLSTYLALAKNASHTAPRSVLLYLLSLSLFSGGIGSRPTGGLGVSGGCKMVMIEDRPLCLVPGGLSINFNVYMDNN